MTANHKEKTNIFYTGTRDKFIWWSLFIIGTINNFSYVVVGSAAQSIVLHFNVPNDIGLITFANVGLGFFFKGINAFFMENVSYRLRMFLNALVMFLGLIGVAAGFFIKPFESFGFVLAAIVLVGVASAYGESVVLGYLRMYPSTLVGGWSSGTGMAGVGGSAFYMLLYSVAKLDNETIFLICLPLCFVFYIVFLLIDRELQLHHRINVRLLDDDGHDEHDEGIKGEDNVHEIDHDEKKLLGNNDYNIHNDGDDSTFSNPPPSVPLGSSSVHDYDNDDEHRKTTMATVTIQKEGLLGGAPRETTGQRILRCLKLSAYAMINLAAVYFFEYVVSTGCADKSNPHCDSKSGTPLPPSCHHFPVRNAYTILSFCYQAGVFISRSSLSIIKIPYIGTLSILQMLNFILWMLNVQYKFLNIWLQFVLMVYVGLLGGCSYVNIFYLVLNDGSKIPKKDKELCVNLTSLMNNGAIAIAAGFVVLMDHTFFKNI